MKPGCDEAPGIGVPEAPETKTDQTATVSANRASGNSPKAIAQARVTQRELWIAIRDGHLGKIRHQQMTFDEYVEWLRHQYVTLPITKARYAELTNEEKGAVKKNLAFSLGAKYSGTERKGIHIKLRETLNLDLDKLEPTDYEAVLAKAKALGFPFLHVGSASNTVNGKRSGRLIVPLDRSVEPDFEFPAISRKIAAQLGIDLVDPASHQKNQVCYVPARCSDAEPVFEVIQ